MRQNARSSLILCALFAACAAAPTDGDAQGGAQLQTLPVPSPTPSAPATAPSAPAPAAMVANHQAAAEPAPTRAYDPASGAFVVHEWGTFTSVVASDGHVLPGLHHEEEDLPGFVADRMAQAQRTPDIVMRKMETPVTYFYAPTPRSVRVKVAFPQGIFTQWYPYVQSTLPLLYLSDPADIRSVIDPWISSSAALEERCRPRFERPSGGLLDWGTVDLLARDSQPALAGPLGENTWIFSRKTAANPLRVRVAAQDHHEKFLFYRGLGDFPLPTEIQVGEQVRLHNQDSTDAIGAAFLVNVTEEALTFTALGSVPPGGTRAAAPPSGRGPTQMDEFRRVLGAVLVADGLYSDEAEAMLSTWQHSYFRTPGLRLLYLMPQAQTDRIIPLTVEPRPDRLHRTMVIRVELMTPALEQRLAQALTALASPATRAAGRQQFLSYRRYAEPYLARALEGARNAAERAAGEALREEIRARRRWAPLTVE